MKGLRVEISTPVQDGPNKPILYWRKTNYFFTHNNQTPSTNEKGEHWFFDNRVGQSEALLLLESFWDYCVRHNRIERFDDEVKIRYEYVPLSSTIYTDKYQFVKRS